MKKVIGLFLVTLCMVGTTTSCLSEEHEFGKPAQKEEAKGKVLLDLTANAEFEAQTRALNEASYANTSNYNVKIINTANDNVVLECKASELGSNLPKTLDIGSYKVEASYGKEYDASRNDFLMFGSATVTIKAKDEKSVTVNCAPTCGKVSVTFDSSMANYYSDYNVSFGGTKKLGSKTFDWAKNDAEPWYIALDEQGETVNYNINLTAKEDYLHQNADGSSNANGQVKGSFQLERNKAHKLTIKPNYTPTTDGGMKLTITIDESTNDQEITWEVPVTWI